MYIYVYIYIRTQRATLKSIRLGVFIGSHCFTDQCIQYQSGILETLRAHIINLGLPVRVLIPQSKSRTINPKFQIATKYKSAIQILIYMYRAGLPFDIGPRPIPTHETHKALNAHGAHEPHGPVGPISINSLYVRA